VTWEFTISQGVGFETSYRFNLGQVYTGLFMTLIGPVSGPENWFPESIEVPKVTPELQKIMAFSNIK
jgi:hypothetical protein